MESQLESNETSVLLRSWGVPETVIQRFKDNEILIDQLKQISDEILKELCPLIGHRLLLKSKLNEYITANTDTDTAKSVSINESDIGGELYDIPIENLWSNTRPPFPEFDLKTLLSFSPCGNGIINYYASYSTLTDKHRNQLVDIIVRHIFTRVVNHKITHEEYNIITGKIILLFPKETAGTYFVPAVKKKDSVSGKSLFAKGKLVDKIRNTIYKSGEKRKSLAEFQNDERIKKCKFTEELTEEDEYKISFLRNNTEPWTKIIEYWNETYPHRKYCDKKSVAEFLQQWTSLNDPRGDILINLDFEQKFKEYSHNLYKNWQPFMEKIINVRFNNNKDDTLTYLYENIHQQCNDDHKIPHQIKLLCYLVPPKGRLNRKIKFSTLECIENFIVDVEHAGDIEHTIINQQKKTANQNLTLQPYLISCGNGSNKYYYLVVDRLKYRFESAFKAFDILFKSYHVLHACYPAAASHLYLIIQRCVYGFETQYDQMVPYIIDVIKSCKI